jgi:hypothetical protein
MPGFGAVRYPLLGIPPCRFAWITVLIESETTQISLLVWTRFLHANRSSLRAKALLRLDRRGF